MRVHSLVVMVAGVLVLALATPARAESPELKKARNEFDQLQFDEAEATLERAIRTGKNGPDDLVSFYLLDAEIASAKGDDQATQKAFIQALMIRPETALPAGSAPKVAQQYAKARAWIDKNGALTARVEGDRKKHVVRITVKDPLEIARSVVVLYDDDGEQRATQAGESPFDVPVPPRDSLSVKVQILDEHGNRLQELGPIEVDTDGEALIQGPSGPATPRVRSWYAKWWLWGGVALIGAGAGTYFGLEVKKAEDDAVALVEKSNMSPVNYSELQAIEKRGKNAALGANISFGAAGVAAVVAVYLLVTEPDAPASADRDTSGLQPILGSDTVGLGYSGSF